MRISVIKIAVAIATLASIPFMNLHARDTRAHTSSKSSVKRTKSSGLRSRSATSGRRSERKSNIARERSQAEPTVEVFRDEAALLPTHDDDSDDVENLSDDSATALIPPR